MVRNLHSGLKKLPTLPSEREFIKSIRDQRKITRKEFKPTQKKIKDLEKKEMEITPITVVSKKDINKLQKTIKRLKKSKETSFLKKKAVSKRVLRKVQQPTLDLRKDKVGIVKQHGFKTMEISNTNFLFN